MKIEPLHDWDLSPKAAIALQIDLASHLISDLRLQLDDVKTVAGVDVSVKGGIARAAVVLMKYPELSTVEAVSAQCETKYPYIPGLLAFREGPVIVEALRKIKREPDVFLFDGMGQIHPRRMGIAAHLGLWLRRPTIGCGKSHFIGEYQLPGLEKGGRSPLMYRGEQLGVVLRTRKGVKPVYVSVGHLCEMESAARLVLACAPKYRLPEPIRAAHKAASLSAEAKQ
ncbi:MAG: deoxyribonuclease V [Chloroflexi bacterium]|nr:deoxyribonuclease V [Chloroflexota bacterium]